MLNQSCQDPLKTTGVLRFFAAALRDGVDQVGHLSRARLRNWRAPGKHWPLTGLTAAGEYAFSQRRTTGFVAMTDPEVLAVAQALDYAAQDIAAFVASPASPGQPLGLEALLATRLAAQPALTASNGLLNEKRTGRFALALGDRETERSGIYSTIELSDLLNSTVAPDGGLHIVLDGRTATILDMRWKGAPLDAVLLATYRLAIATPTLPGAPTNRPLS